MTLGLDVMGMVVIFVVVPVEEGRRHFTSDSKQIAAPLVWMQQERGWLTRHDVAADDFPAQGGQWLGHNSDDAAAGRLHVGGAAARRRYSGADVGTNSGSRVRGLGSCTQMCSVMT